jgi:glutathione S-transferase
MAGPVPQLVQFSFSHYNEKARWALDYKLVRHTRRSLLPGQHMMVMPRLTGQTQTPVLCVGDEHVVGSGAIIDWLERHRPEHALYPKAAEERERALEIARWFDEKIGPDIRRAFFFEMLPCTKYLPDLMSAGFPAAARVLYRAAYPGLRIVLRREMQLTQAGAEAGRARTQEGLDFVVRNAGADGYLVGGRFSVADLTAASLLAVTCFPPGFGGHIPPPHPPQLTRWLERWERHPGVDWVRSMFLRKRGVSAEVKI